MNIRHAAVDGMFYPKGANQLKNEVNQYINTASAQFERSIKAMIAPHAGYMYSGAIAGTAYKALQNCIENFQRVILLGPAHRERFEGVAHADANQFETPLGCIETDSATINTLETQGLVFGYPLAHRDEHCLEVQLPFIQVLSNELKIIPLLVGEASPQEVCNLLQSIWQPTDLILVSSDLSHYLPYAEAVHKDGLTSEKICGFDAKINGSEACGCRAIGGLLIFAKQKGWKIECLDLRNSGDTAGDKSRVVGYGAYVFA